MSENSVDCTRHTSAAGDVAVDGGAGLIHGYLRAMKYCAESERRKGAWHDAACS
ncbi:hypothetical protein [Nisaea sediminum]|uniref:hypothetical protein n=1 Tax=Nisaea sediminum TaxID=2775867 RepID=UPI00186692DC|nr:hypothetical protein [Nisaea sediminum]